MAGRPDPKPPKATKRPRTPLRTRPKPKASEAEREAQERFRRLVLALDGGCCVHRQGACRTPLEIHHVVSQQSLRHAGRDDLRWDPLNGMAICVAVHARHTKAVQRLSLTFVPERCKAFARKHGFAYILERYYAA